MRFFKNPGPAKDSRAGIRRTGQSQEQNELQNSTFRCIFEPQELQSSVISGVWNEETHHRVWRHHSIFIYTTTHGASHPAKHKLNM